MFEKVDSIEWAKLSHAHGTAEDVPLHLFALVDGTKEECDQALGYFWEYMLHQGSRYEASPYVVQFLFEALEHAAPKIQRDLIDLLLGLAVGYGESFLPFGYNLEVEEKRFSERSWGGLFVYSDAARSAYFEVHERANEFPRFLQSNYDSEVRLSAAFAVAHFAQPLASYHAEVAGIIAGEKDEEQLHSLMLCYGMLGRFASSQVDVAFLLRYLEPGYSKILRLTAAISITTLTSPLTPETVLQTLLNALNESWDVSLPRERLRFQWWNEGDLFGYAALALQLISIDRRDEIAQVLCSVLVNSDACTFSIPETLLNVLFPEPKPSDGRKISDMDNVQLASLQTLLGTNHWRDWMINSKFLPVGLTNYEYQPAMQKFLSEAMEGKQLEFDLFQRAGNVSSWDLKNYWNDF